jgi:hypothetical protein
LSVMPPASCVVSSTFSRGISRNRCGLTEITLGEALTDATDAPIFSAQVTSCGE